jgi:hypothetical protein
MTRMDRKRPGALLAIALIGIGLGALGGCLGLYTIAATALTGQMAEFQEQMAEMQPDSAQREFQRELNRAVLEVQARYRVGIIAHQGANFLASIVLLVAAIALMRWKKSAPGLMTIAVIANVLVDLGGSVLQFFMHRENTAVMEQVMTQFDGAGGPPGMERTMQGVMGASAAMGICWLVALLVLKLGYYGWAAMYVKKPQTRELLNA